MISIAHVMDDMGMGGVTRALTLFDEPQITSKARSEIVTTRPDARLAPKLSADLIVDHATFSWARLPFLLSLRARNPQARLVHVEHSYTRAFEQGEVGSKRRFRALLRFASGLFDDVVCVSNAQREWLADDVGIARAKLRVIYPWTDRTSLFTMPVTKPRTSGPINLLAYGRYAKVKNFAALIQAMRAFEPYEARLTVFGDGPDRDALERLASDLPHVEVHGPSSDPAPYLKACDAVIVPSRYEAFGLVATEARMAARPVIAADVDGLPEQAGEGGCAFPMDNAAQIAEAIHWAINADIAPMGLAARGGVEGQHAQILQRWTRLIEEVESDCAFAKTKQDALVGDEFLA